MFNSLPRAVDALYDSQREGAPTICFKGTRVAILDQVIEWMKNTSPETPQIYWINGMAGIGKSTVACTACKRAVLLRLRLVLVSYFFSRTQADLSTARLFISSIAYQIGQCDHRVKACIGEALEKNPDIPYQNRQRQMSELLIGPLLASNIEGPIIVVVDALDECEPKHAQELLSLILICAKRVPFLRFLITSRPEPHISKILSPNTTLEAVFLHNVEEHVITADIKCYLQAELTRIAREFDISSSLAWPSPVDVTSLVEKSGKLFVYAATVIRFIADEEVWSPVSQLRIALGSETAKDAKPHAKLDELYLEVLRNTIKESQRKDLVERLRHVVGAIILLRNPLPIASLASLLNVPKSDVIAALRRLHSLIIQSGQNPPRIYHKSFPDFITDPSRCPDLDFLIVRSAQHSQLAQHCFTTMAKGLKKNVLGLSNPFLPNHNIPDFDAKMVFKFPPELRYACQYWVSHLLEASKEDIPRPARSLEEFGSQFVSWWIEPMSLLDKMSPAASSLQRAHQWTVSGSQSYS